jgi:hypothetical protein
VEIWFQSPKPQGRGKSKGLTVQYVKETDRKRQRGTDTREETQERET